MGSKSSSTATTTQNEYFDQRSVNDAAGGIVGNGNSQDSSQTWLQSTTDNRVNKNSGNSTWNSDSSQTWTQNTTNTDGSSRSYSNSGNTTWNSTDGGAIAGMTDIGLAQIGLVEKLARIAQGGADTVASAAIQAQQNALSAGTAANASALDFAKSNNVMAFKSNSDALGFAGDKFDEVASLTRSLLTSAQKQADSAAGTVSAAYSSAASQANGNKTLVIAALAAVAVVAAAVVFRKG